REDVAQVTERHRAANDVADRVEQIRSFSREGSATERIGSNGKAIEIDLTVKKILVELVAGPVGRGVADDRSCDRLATAAAPVARTVVRPGDRPSEAQRGQRYEEERAES